MRSIQRGLSTTNSFLFYLLNSNKHSLINEQWHQQFQAWLQELEVAIKLDIINNFVL